MESVASLDDAETVVQPDMVLHVLSVLTQPIAKGSVEKSQQGHVISFDDILKESIKNLKACLSQDKNLEAVARRFTLSEEDDIHWQFVIVCLDLLKLLNQSMKEALKTYNDSLNEDKKVAPNDSETVSDQKNVSKRKQVQAPPDVLNVGQQKTVSTVFQFIVCLGVGPCLSPGVGVPVEFRSGYGQYLKSSRTVEVTEKINRLSTCLDVLLDCALQPSFGSLFLASHLNDLLAALIQLCYGYTRSYDEANSTNDTAKNSSGEQAIDIDYRLKNIDLSTASPGVIVSALQTPAAGDTRERADDATSLTKSPIASSDSSSNDSLFTVCRQKYEKSLNDLLQCVYPPLLVKELVVLQGGPRQPPKKGGKVLAFPRAPPWLRRACGRLLSEQVMKPLGVHHVLRGLLQGAEGSGGSSTSDASGTGDDWKKCSAIAQIIANCPKQACSVEKYYRLISPQVLQLFHIKDRMVARQFIRVASSIVSAMVKQNPDLARIHIISPLLNPLNKCLDINDEIQPSEPGVIWLSDKDLTSCVEDIYKVFVTGPDPHANLLMCLMPVVAVIFKLLCFCKSGVSHLRSACQEIVTTFLKSIDKGVAFHVLKALAFNTRLESGDNTHGYRVMHPALKFVPGEDGGVAVITCARETSDDEGNKTDVQVGCLVEILRELESGGLAGEFFLFFLEELTSVLSQEDDISTDSHQSSCSRGEELLNIEHGHERILRNNERRLMIMMLLIKMCETMDHTYLTSAQQVIKFAKTTLLRSIYILEHTEDVDTGVFESETITLAIGLLTATMSGAVEIKAYDRERMNELLPLLDTLATEHPHEEVQDMASDIRIAIATYGAVWTDSLASAAKKFSKREENEQTPNKVKGQKLIEEITSAEEKVTSAKKVLKDTGEIGEKNKEKFSENGSAATKPRELVDCSANKSGVRKGAIVTEPYGSDGAISSNPDDRYGKSGESGLLGQCLNELCDPLIPVRGHALITLAKLVKQKDAATLEKTELLLGIFKENIAHDDSYIYLAAINGLAGLSEINHVETVPMLAEEFITVVDSTRKPRAVELRMKLAEVLMKVSRSLGDLIPKYREVLVNAFLAGSKDPDHLIRASSLSNLGQVCQLLRFSLGGILQEVFLCTSSLLRNDPAVEVRRAAVMVITMILRGTSHDAIQILGTTLRDIYRLLKLCSTTEKDETVRLQTQLALEEVDDIMKTYSFPKQSLVKTIYVADKPC